MPSLDTAKPGWYWQPPVCFPQGSAECWNLSTFSQSYRVGLAFCVCSQAICKDSLSPSSSACTRSWPWGEGPPIIGGDCWSTGGVQKWGSHSTSWVGFLVESVKQLVGSLSLWCPLRVLSAILPDASCPQSYSTPQYSGWGKKEVVTLVTSHTAGEAGQSLTHSHFPLWEESWAKKISLGTELFYLKGGVIQLKGNCFSFPLQCVKSQGFFVFFLEWCAGTSLLDSSTSTNALLSMSGCLNYYYLKGEQKTIENSYFAIWWFNPKNVLKEDCCKQNFYISV